MDIQVTGKQMDLGDALQSHVTEKLADGVKKYFERGADAAVTFAKSRRMIECDVTARLASGVFLAAHGEAGDAYGAFEESLEKLEKRIRRYKRRLKNHHANDKEPLPAEQASYFLLKPFDEENDEENGELAPVIVAESQTQLRIMTVGDAVMQLDLAEQPAIIAILMTPFTRS